MLDWSVVSWASQKIHRVQRKKAVSNVQLHPKPISDTLSAVNTNLHELHSVDGVVSSMQSQNLTMKIAYIIWRSITGLFGHSVSITAKNIYCLNDLDSQRGTFSHCDFVHCSEIFTERGYIYTCECKIYKTLLDDARKVSNCTNLQYYTGVVCSWEIPERTQYIWGFSL